MDNAKHYRPEIDGLRAWAVLPVLLFHAGVPGFSGGFVGVDVFFVISGYLITKIIYSEMLESNFSIVRFYERRARRILPALTVVLLVATAVAAILMSPQGLIDYGKSLGATVFFGSNVWFWRTTEGYFAANAKASPLLHTWSLAVEEQFYIFFPLLLILCVKLAPKHVRSIAVAVVVASFVYAVWRMNDSSVWQAEHTREVFYLPMGRIWELGLGSLLALGVVPAIPEKLRTALGVIALALIALPVFLYDESTPFPGIAALAPVLGAALVIHLGESGPTRILTWRPFVWVGLISYSLYLWHWPLIVLLRGMRGGAELPPSWSFGVIIASTLLAWLSWRYVERPFRQRGVIERPAFFKVCGAALAGLLALAAGLWAMKGLPQRFSPTELAVLGAQQDVNARRGECAMKDADELCRVGADDVAPSFLIWGDSHGDSAQPGIELAAQRAGVNGYVSSRWGCAPLIGVEQSAEDCTDANEAIKSWLKAHSEVGLVVLVARWPLYESGRYETGERQPRPFFLPGPDTPAGASGAELMRTALGQTVSELTAMGKRVVILGDVPEIGWHVPTQISAFRRFGAPLPPVPTAEEVAARHARSDAMIRELDVEFVPVFSSICGSECRIVDAHGIPLYSDSNHVTAPASREVYAPLVEPLLRKGRDASSAESGEKQAGES